MALSETDGSGENVHPKPSTDSTKPTTNERKEKPLTKIIVRRLPPGIDKESFLQQVSPVPDYDYIYLVRGDMSLGENAFSRIYINFVHSKDVYIFKEKFDNYVFIDGKGHEYAAVVEFAAFQKIPKRRSKFRVDPKCNTIETDPMYLEFLESLKDQPVDEEKPEYSYQPSTEVKKDISTPLLDYIKQRRIDKQRIREEKREERKRRENERKKIREEDRRKRKTEPSPVASTTKPSFRDKDTYQKTYDVKEKEETKSDRFEKPEKPHRRFEDRKISPKVKPTKPNVRNEKTYEKKAEYKKKTDDAKAHKYNDREAKRENASESTKQPMVKKVKKYSERREERKIEAQRAESKKTVLGVEANDDAANIARANSETKDKKSNEGGKKNENLPDDGKQNLTSLTSSDVSAKNDKEKYAQDADDDDYNNAEESAGSRIYNSEPSLFNENFNVTDDAMKTERRKSMDESKSDGLTKENESKIQRQSSLNDETSDGYVKRGGKGSKRNKENDPRTERRIRNKDRPTMQIYKPGMLSRRKHSDVDEPKM